MPALNAIVEQAWGVLTKQVRGALGMASEDYEDALQMKRNDIAFLLGEEVTSSEEDQTVPMIREANFYRHDRQRCRIGSLVPAVAVRDGHSDYLTGRDFHLR